MSRRTDRYKKNLNLRKEGKYPGLPIHLAFPKLGKFLPSLPRELMLILFAGTGAGKTQFWKRLSLELVKLHMKDPKMPKPLFILNLLEESKDEFEDGLVCMLYYDIFEKDILKVLKDKGKWTQRISKMRLNSYEVNLLTDEELSRIETTIDPLVETIMEVYYIVNDSIYHPIGLFKFAEKIAKSIGKFIYIPVNVAGVSLTSEQYTALSDIDKKNYQFFKYVENDDNVKPCIITDHLELMSEKDSNGVNKSTWQVMRDWSFEHGRKKISKIWGWNMINILQANSSSQEKKYDNRGNLNWDSLKPTLNSLSANKVIAQDHHVVIGLNDPTRHSSNLIMDGFDLSKCNNRFRSNHVLKNRVGPANSEIPMYFDGKTSTWLEIYGSKSPEGDLKDLHVKRSGKRLMDYYELCKT